ncbi:peptidoglycan-binding domain-containing protein [Enterococcus gallinarum]|uniref:peptidoglycan-binding domain-containing protein n=1 Tax=Enterococcus gallinarum TaxID=1353 RepID=UPI0018A9A678|nr:peptidoglycan-binding domain-containing protein [Enterococcus gallinarum]
MSTRLTHHFYRIVTIGNSDVNIDNSAQMIKLAIDGQWESLVTLRLQEYYNTTRDKVISHQYKQKYNQNIYSAEFDTTLIGSDVIRAIQMGLKARGYYSGAIDGLCGEATIKAMQKALGITVDGIISPKSDMVRALQRALNKNKLPW